MMKKMSEDDFDDYLGVLSDKINGIETRQDLSSVIFLLCKGYREGAFEEQDAYEYLSGLGSILDALDSWCRNNDMDDDPDVPTWRLLGDVLYASFYHS